LSTQVSCLLACPFIFHFHCQLISCQFSALIRKDISAYSLLRGIMWRILFIHSSLILAISGQIRVTAPIFDTPLQDPQRLQATLVTEGKEPALHSVSFTFEDDFDAWTKVAFYVLYEGPIAFSIPVGDLERNEGNHNIHFANPTISSDSDPFFNPALDLINPTMNVTSIEGINEYVVTMTFEQPASLDLIGQWQGWVYSDGHFANSDFSPIDALSKENYSNL